MNKWVHNCINGTVYSQEFNFSRACNKVIITNLCKQYINMLVYTEYYTSGNILHVILISNIIANN
jgi:hypothetical protein